MFALGQLVVGLGAGIVGALLYVLTHGTADMTARNPVFVLWLQRNVVPPAVIVSVLGGAGSVAAWTAWILRRQPPEIVRSVLGLRGASDRTLVGWTLAGVGAALTLLPFALLLGSGGGPRGAEGPLARMATSSTSGLVTWILLAIFCAPLLEELLFRGLMWSAFAGTRGPGSATAITAFLFTIVHLGETWAAPILLLPISLLGVGAGVARARTGSVWPSAAMHLAYNSTVVVLALLAS